MSPRKNNTITMKAWPEWRVGRLYTGKVKSVHHEKASDGLRVTIEHLDPCQLGRTSEMELPPARPGNKTSSFLTACGIDASTPGTTICLDQVKATIVGMRFRGAVSGSDDFDFERIPSSSVADADGENKDP